MGDKAPVLIVVSGIAKQEKQTRRRDHVISDVFTSFNVMAMEIMIYLGVMM